MGRKAKNTAQDWVLAAFAALDEKGIDGVKVEPLAKKLGTTKGSFYWHFADRPALLTAMLDFWDQEGTQAIITLLDDGNLSADKKLLKLVEIAAETKAHGLNAARVEGALRAWAGQDPDVAKRIAKTERTRIAYVEKLLSEIGHPKAKCAEKAMQVYLMLLGYYSIARHDEDPIFKQRLIAYTQQLSEGP